MSKIVNVDVRFMYKGRKTTCIISKNKEIISTSFAKRLVTDEENKPYARKVAFKKAMDQTKDVLNKEEREAVWNEFRKTVKQPVK